MNQYNDYKLFLKRGTNMPKPLIVICKTVKNKAEIKNCIFKNAPK